MWRTNEFLLVILSLIDFSGSQTMKQATWKQLPSFYVNLKTVQRTLKVSDQSACAFSCLSYTSCINFYYNPITTDCSHGAWLVTRMSPRPSPSAVFSNGYYCDEAANYIIYGNSYGTVCVYASDVTMNFTSAFSVCREKNAGLFKIHNIGRLYMLQSISGKMPSREFWVGIDDLDQDNVFRITNTGATVTPTLEAEIFVPGSNNNTNVGQDCGLFSKIDNQLVRSPCSTSQYFLCEMFAAP